MWIVYLKMQMQKGLLPEAYNEMRSKVSMEAVELLRKVLHIIR